MFIISLTGKGSGRFGGWEGFPGGVSMETLLEKCTPLN